MALEPNSTFGNYRIGEVIGEGGMGQVYLATDTTLDRKVAIKVLPESFAQDVDRVARFEREAKTLASLNHNNIAQIYGIEKGVVTAIVMELVEGPTLADRIAEGPLPPEEALRIARQIIDGLEAAHDKGIVHRDLKPANIKVKADGLVKILDFGIAKSIEGKTSSGRHTPTMVTPAFTESGVIMGTAAYMSPEQAQGKFVDQRTDIWAFGCVVFEMLTGQPVFAGENVMITLARILDREADLHSIPGMVSPAVRHTLKLCLEKNPAKRLHHIGDVRLGLVGGLESGLSAARELAKTKTNWWLPLATAVVAAAASVGITLVLMRPPEAEVTVAEVRRSIFTMPAEQSFTIPNVPALNLSNDGSRLVYTANAGIYVRGLDELEARFLAGTDGDSALVPVFSPDGRAIAYGSAASGELKTVSVEGGTPLPVLREFPANGWTWSGDRIVYGTDNTVMEIPASGGAPVLLLEEEAGALAMEPARISGTELVLYERRIGGVDEGVVVAASVASGERTVLFPGRQPKYLDAGYLVYFEPTLGIMARAFDPLTLAFGPPIVMVSDILYRQGVGGVQWRVAENGTLLYEKGAIGGSSGERVFIADETGIERELNLPPGGYGYPAVSPDGTQLVMQDGLDIYVYDLDGSSEPRQLTRDGQSFTPTWSLDGETITYAAFREGTYRIWRQRADGSGVPEALTEGTAGEQSFPAWAPDGRLTFTMVSEGGDLDVWIQSLPLGEPELLVFGEGQQNMLRFSPQGTAMAYRQGGATAGAVVMVQPYPPDGSSARVSQAGEIGIRPVWSTDGNTLYYQVPAGQNFNAVDISVPGFALRNRRELPYLGAPNAHRLAVMPDGKLVLTIPQGNLSGGGSELVIVENWIEEIKRRVPRE